MKKHLQIAVGFALLFIWMFGSSFKNPLLIMEAPIPKGLDPTVWQALTYLFGLLLFTIIVWLITRFVNAVDQLAKTVATLILQVNSIQGEVDNMKADVTKVKKRFIAGPTDWDQP